MPESESNINETIRKVLSMLVRRRWWILVTAPIVASLTLVVLSFIPNQYTSEATLLVVQQQVPQRYVVPTATTDMNDALQATTEEVLSRTGLLGIIDEFGLFAKQRKTYAPESLVELMRKNIDIKPLENTNPAKHELNAFKISFTANEPHLAQDVTSRLTTLFIEENLTTRERQSTITTNFLGEQLEAAKKKLAEQEELVRNYKLENLGELPEQQPGNLAILAGLQSQLQNTMAGLSRAQQQQVYLQSLMTGYKSLTPHNPSSPFYTPSSSGRSKPNLIETEEEHLIQLQSKRSTLQAEYTPQHPEVIAVNQEIAQTEALLKKLKSGVPPAAEKTPGDPTPAVPARAQDDDVDVQLKGQMEQVKSQLEANKLEIANLLKDEKQLKDSIALYQNRLNATPVREQQLAGILRDYELLKEDYKDLLGKQMQSQLAASLEKRQEGQQFRLVDRPSLPVIPSKPKRLVITLGGFAAGLVLGLALAFGVDFLDSSFHAEQDLKQQFPLPLIVGIPLILTPKEQQARTRKRVLDWALGLALALALVCVEIYGVLKFRHG